MDINNYIAEMDRKNAVCTIRRCPKYEGGFMFEIGESVSHPKEVLDGLTAGFVDMLCETTSREVAENFLMQAVMKIQGSLDNEMGECSEESVVAKNHEMLYTIADNDVMEKLVPEMVERLHEGRDFDDIDMDVTDLTWTASAIKANEIYNEEKKRKEGNELGLLKEVNKKLLETERERLELESLLKRTKDKCDRELKSKNQQILNLTKEIASLEHRLVEMEKANSLISRKE